jgi:homoserine dehydrogenase
MAAGLDYSAALADAQARGYAEPDPADDVQGHDVVAKVRILAAVAFGRALTSEQVSRRGITEVTSAAVRQAVRDGSRMKLVATVRLRTQSDGGAASVPLEANVEPVALPLTDPLAHVDGVLNALTVETDTVRAVTIVGPGAGREQAGQSIFADLVAVARER